MSEERDEAGKLERTQLPMPGSRKVTKKREGSFLRYLFEKKLGPKKDEKTAEIKKD